MFLSNDTIPPIVQSSPVWVPAASSSTAFVTGQTLSSLRNNYLGHVGFKFTVGAASITITELARWVVSGNSGTHAVYLLNSAGSTLGSVSVATSGEPVGYKYVALASSVTMAAGAVGFIVSAEANGGDQWYDAPVNVTTTAAATMNGFAFVGFPLGLPSSGGSANQTFGPSNFRYT